MVAFIFLCIQSSRLNPSQLHYSGVLQAFYALF